MSAADPIARDGFVAQGAGATSASAPGVSAAAGKGSARYPIIVFSQPFQAMNPMETADFVAECGYDGMEIPVRAKGQVEPERAPDELPNYAAALGKLNRPILLAATDIIRIDQPHAESVLRTLAKLGIKRLRLGPQSYDLGRPLESQVREIGAALNDIESACRELGLQAGFQNHSGSNRVGGPVWDVFSMIRNLDPRYLGFCFDIAHATVEGGLSWPIQARLAQPFYTAVLVKDFVWKKTPAGWVPDWGPLGDGLVGRAFFDELKQTDYRGPIVQQFFYPLGDRRQMTVLMRKELHVLKGWLDGENVAPRTISGEKASRSPAGRLF